MITNNYSIPSFGKVYKSAAKNAIKETEGDADELKCVRQLIEEQQDNKHFDIIGLPSRDYYNYMILKSGEEFGFCYMTLDKACNAATKYKNYEIEQEKAERLQEEADAEDLIKEILEKCPDEPAA